MNRLKFKYRFVLIIILVFFPITHWESTQGGAASNSKQNNKYPSVFPLTDDDKKWIEDKISSMSLYDKCAQMIVAPVYRSYLDVSSPDYDSTMSLVRNHNIGGLIMFQGALEKEINFIRDAQKLAEIPLLISADFERGLGMRIDDALEFPNAMALGSTLNSSYAYEMGKAVAEECRLIGVHQNLAPVTDINNNELNPVINIRSFSESKFTASEFASSFILGSIHGRVIATAKHFPGHGNTELDSHTDLPMITGTKQDLYETELFPFINAINSGVQSVMIGHLEVQALDTLPATLSQKITTDLLQKELGFDGLIVADAFNMEAITKLYGQEDAVLLAVKAGNDIILMPLFPVNAISTIYKAVLSGEITEERINHSVRKILAGKRWLKIEGQDDVETRNIIDSLNSLPNKILSQTIADESITLLKNDVNVVPVNLSKYDKISCLTVTDGPGGETSTYFRKILQKRFADIESHLITTQTKTRELNQTISAIQTSDLIIMPVFLDSKVQKGKEKAREELINFINKTIRLRAPVIVISFKTPYLVSQLPLVKTYLNTYSFSRSSQIAALKAILGEIEIKGKLPVSIPKSDYHIGDGITMNKSIETKLTRKLNNELFYNVETIIVNSIRAQRLNNAELCIGKDGKIIYQNYFVKNPDSNLSDTLTAKGFFNLGSLTAPLSIIPAVMMLLDESLISLEDKVYYFIPGFEVNGKNDISIRNIILHNSGLGKNIDSLNINWNKEDLLTAIINSTLKYKTGEKVIYSEINNILLQFVVEKVSGKTLDVFLTERLLKPLGMKNTFYITEQKTERSDSRLTTQTDFKYGSYLSTEDALKNIMDGITGFDGLYSKADDIAVFAQMLIQNGYYDGIQYISVSTVKKFVSPQLPDSYAGLGWQTFISGSNICNELSKSSFGYNSNNGSSLWIESNNKLFIIFLTDSDSENTKSLIPKIQCDILKAISQR